MITSTANKRIKNVMALLTKSKERKKQQAFVAEGLKMFMEAPADWVKEVYLSEEIQKDSHIFATISDKLKELGKDCGVETVAAEVFRKMCDTKTPQGILCVLKMPSYSLDGILKKDKGLYLLLEDIQDPGNLGTMMRTGEGAGVCGIIMSGHTVDMFNPKTIRATMGSIYRVPFVYEQNFPGAVIKMREAGVRLYAAHLDGKNSYDKENYKEATGFLIGNEGNGLSDEVAKLADCYIRIPMEGNVESLNAAIAASLLIYEAARQRRD